MELLADWCLSCRQKTGPCEDGHVNCETRNQFHDINHSSAEMSRKELGTGLTTGICCDSDVCDEKTCKSHFLGEKKCKSNIFEDRSFKASESGDISHMSQPSGEKKLQLSEKVNESQVLHEQTVESWSFCEKTDELHLSGKKTSESQVTGEKISELIRSHETTDKSVTVEEKTNKMQVLDKTYKLQDPSRMSAFDKELTCDSNVQKMGTHVSDVSDESLHQQDHSGKRMHRSELSHDMHEAEWKGESRRELQSFPQVENLLKPASVVMSYVAAPEIISSPIVKLSAEEAAVSEQSPPVLMPTPQLHLLDTERLKQSRVGTSCLDSSGCAELKVNCRIEQAHGTVGDVNTAKSQAGSTQSGSLAIREYAIPLEPRRNLFVRTSFNKLRQKRKHESTKSDNLSSSVTPIRVNEGKINLSLPKGDVYDFDEIDEPSCPPVNVGKWSRGRDRKAGTLESDNALSRNTLNSKKKKVPTATLRL